MDKNGLYIFQKGFNYSQDGPGNRLVYHLCGCNMHCPWCSNPEGLSLENNSTFISFEEITKEVLSSRMIFIDGGGVTFTGGEATMQKDALLYVVKALKKEGVSTCIETNASLPDCEELFDEIDFMIADFKSPFDARTKDIGARLGVIKKNLIYRAKSQKPLLVRVPLVNFFNCDEESFKGFIEFFKELDSVTDNVSFEILTYHEFGKEKYKSVNMEYSVTDGFVPQEKASAFAEKFKKENLKLINT